MKTSISLQPQPQLLSRMLLLMLLLQPEEAPVFHAPPGQEGWLHGFRWPGESLPEFQHLHLAATSLWLAWGHPLEEFAAPHLPAVMGLQPPPPARAEPALLLLANHPCMVGSQLAVKAASLMGRGRVSASAVGRQEAPAASDLG